MKKRMNKKEEKGKKERNSQILAGDRTFKIPLDLCWKLGSLFLIQLEIVNA